MPQKRKMELEEFLEVLRKTPRKWKLKDGWIRLQDGRFEYEPITAVCKLITGKRFRLVYWDKAAEAIGLDDNLAHDILIVTYPDDNEFVYSPNLRDKLLEATGLS